MQEGRCCNFPCFPGNQGILESAESQDGPRFPGFFALAWSALYPLFRMSKKTPGKPGAETPEKLVVEKPEKRRLSWPFALSRKPRNPGKRGKPGQSARSWLFRMCKKATLYWLFYTCRLLRLHSNKQSPEKRGTNTNKIHIYRTHL